MAKLHRFKNGLERNWQAHEVNMVNLARSAALCCTITTLISDLYVDFFVDTLLQSNEEKSQRRFWIRPGRT